MDDKTPIASAADVDYLADLADLELSLDDSSGDELELSLDDLDDVAGGFSGHYPTPRGGWSKFPCY